MDRFWIVEHALTGEILHRELPVRGTPTRELSGAGSLRASITPDDGLLGALPNWIMPWDVILNLEENGTIRWSGFVNDAGWDGPTWEMDCKGTTSYLFDQPYLGEYSKVRIDPADASREIVRHLMEQENGNVRLNVRGETSMLVGAETEQKQKRNAKGEIIRDAKNEPVMETVPVPYELNWWDNPDCGDEFIDLANEGGYEWMELNYWNDDRTQIIHDIIIADRIGARREDLLFEQGVNISKPVPYVIDGLDVVNEAHLIGAGEGKKSLRESAAVVRPGRVRRARAILAKDVKDKNRARSLARAAVASGGGQPLGTRIEVRNHSHARFGSFDVGDMILVRADIPWIGEQTNWMRIERISMTSPSHATLELI